MISASRFFVVIGIFTLLMPAAAFAQAKEGFVGRLPCAHPTDRLRKGTFNLTVGRVRLANGKACLKPFSAYPGCEWDVELTRTETWGTNDNYLLVVVNANHDTPGAWDSVFMFVCREDVYAPVFADNYLYGAKVALGRESNFEVTAGEWLPDDPGCCPSRERTSTYGWNDQQRSFALVESKVTVRENSN